MPDDALFATSSDGAVNSFLDLADDLDDDGSDCSTGDDQSIVADVPLSLVAIALLPFLQLIVWGNHLLYLVSSMQKEQFFVVMQMG